MKLYLPALILLASSLTSCDSGDTAPLKGYLYFGAGSYLGAFNLETGDATPVISLGDLEIDYVSAFDNDELLLSVSSPTSVRSRERILRFDLSENRTKEFLLGAGALYIAQSDQILYESGGKLLTVSRRDTRGPASVILERERRLPVTIVSLPNSQVLIGFTQDTRQTILLADLTTSKVESKEALANSCALYGALWITDNALLLCKPPTPHNEDARYRMVSIEGQPGAALSLPEQRDFRAVTYLAEEKTIVFDEIWQNWFDDSPKHAVWVHDLQSGKNRKLADNQRLGSSVVYRRLQY